MKIHRGPFRWSVPVCLALGLYLVLGSGCRDEQGSDAQAPAEPPAPHGDLLDVALPSESVVLLLESSGRLLRSEDRGNHWSLARVPAVVGLRRLEMADADVGFALGQSVVLRTEDGGRNWRQQRLPGSARDRRLHDLAVQGRDRAMIVGEGGLWLRTQDGGALWQVETFAAEAEVEAGDASAAFEEDEVRVACDALESARCFMAGNRVRLTQDGGDRWHPVRVPPQFESGLLRFDSGRAEMRAEEVQRLTERLAERDVDSRARWSIESFVTSQEFERLGVGQDPQAVFDLLEARTSEVRLLLENQGVPAAQIETPGAPPWDFADLLDDDPDTLRRYWDRRVGPESATQVLARAPHGIQALLIQGGRGVAVTEQGRVLHWPANALSKVASEEASGAPSRVSPESVSISAKSRAATVRVAEGRLIDLAVGAEGPVTVGTQGGVFRADAESKTWHSIQPSGIAPFFETLHSVAFDPSGRFGMIVGEQGRILVSRDGGREWSGTAQDDSSETAPVPMVP